jgi:hypothetical protein
MDYDQTVGLFADWAAILTAAVAVIFGAYFWRDGRKKRLKLEDHLRKTYQEAKARSDRDNGKRSIAHLIADLRMTEDEIVQAAFGSTKILAQHSRDDPSGEDMVHFEYRETTK